MPRAHHADAWRYKCPPPPAALLHFGRMGSQIIYVNRLVAPVNCFCAFKPSNQCQPEHMGRTEGEDCQGTAGSQTHCHDPKHCACTTSTGPGVWCGVSRARRAGGKQPATRAVQQATGKEQGKSSAGDGQPGCRRRVLQPPGTTFLLLAPRSQQGGHPPAAPRHIPTYHSTDEVAKDHKPILS